MVVADLDVVGAILFPSETDSPLVIDPDAVLELAVPRELLEPVSGRSVKVSQCCSGLDHEELPVG